ncbi:type II toxin-antitoxin system ParD family antitoxin [Citrobacter sp. R56]|nr:type II toxin-antitoxin system ParD family antitoxin [Citrobacter sp. R56]
MPGRTSITIADHPDRFIIKMVNTGRSGSTREVVRSAL